MLAFGGLAMASTFPQHSRLGDEREPHAVGVTVVGRQHLPRHDADAAALGHLGELARVAARDAHPQDAPPVGPPRSDLPGGPPPWRDAMANRAIRRGPLGPVARV